MHPILFKIGKLELFSYGFFMAIGISTAIILSFLRARRKGLDPEAMVDIGFWGVLFGIIGAKLLYFISVIPDIVKNPSEITEHLRSGFVVYGGIIGGALAAYIYCRKKKLNFLKYFDLAAPAIAIAQGIGRIGCFMAGCCYGSETTSSLGVVFKEYSIAPSGVRLHPTQIYESFGDFFICAILIYLSTKNKKSGRIGALYMIFYSILRFIIEYFRDDFRGNVGSFSTSQFICIFVFLGGLLLFFRKERLDS